MHINTVTALCTTPMTIPLDNMVSKFENLSIQLDNSLNMPVGSVVYLYDRSLAIQHDLCQGAYHFTSDQNDNRNRFELRVVPQASVNIENVADVSTVVYKSADQLILELQESLEAATTIQIINSLGQVVASKNIAAGQSAYAVTFNNLLEGNMYIVSIPELGVSKKIKW